QRPKPDMQTTVARVELVSHAADRLADAIIVATRAPTDPRTLSAWGHHVGVSRGTLRVWGRAAHTSARGGLDFLRVLRAVHLSRDHAWDLFSLLDVIDDRTVGRLLDRGGVRQLLSSTHPPSIDEFVAAQRFVERADVLRAVLKRLEGDSAAA